MHIKFSARQFFFHEQYIAIEFVTEKHVDSKEDDLITVRMPECLPKKIYKWIYEWITNKKWFNLPSEFFFVLWSQLIFLDVIDQRHQRIIYHIFPIYALHGTVFLEAGLTFVFS